MKKIALLLLVAACLGAGGVKAEVQPEAQAAKPVKRCEPVSGTRLGRLPDAQGRCDPAAPGWRSFTQDEIQRTGQIDVGEALRQLDPSLAGRSGR